MNYINAFIFGIVQGLTEFLPISSSGHLIILHEFLNSPMENDLVFDVVLHLATILAVILFFRKDVIRLASSWLKSINGNRDKDGELAWFIIFATIPAGLSGYFFDDLIEKKFRSPLLVVFMLVFVGIFFILVEKTARRNKELKDITLKDAMIIGFAQVLALIPGTSRSGVTVLAGLRLGFMRNEAIRFSFLLSIPIVFGAFIKKIPQVFAVNFSGGELVVLLVAFFSSFFSGILAIKYFLDFSKKYSLKSFAYYRFLFAIVLLLVYFFEKVY